METSTNYGAYSTFRGNLGDPQLWFRNICGGRPLLARDLALDHRLWAASNSSSRSAI